MKFYLTPGSCSTGIHILLEELELVFEAYIVNLQTGAHLKPEFLAINPKATIPVLVLDDGNVLTEFPAIAYWLACRYPKAGLMPNTPLEAARVLELVAYVVATLHGQGFARIFTTDKFTDQPDDFPKVKAKGLEIIDQAFTIINGLLPDDGYAFSQFSIADAALFYVEFWADKSAIVLPGKCAKHYQLMLSRPVVRRVLQEEGYRL